MDVEAREAFHEGVGHQKRQFMLSIEEKGEGEILSILDVGGLGAVGGSYVPQKVPRILASHSKI